MKTPFKAFLILLTLTLAVGCTNRNSIPINSLNDVLTNLAPSSKSFEIKPGEETMLKCSRGTRIYIPADAFQFADGSVPTSAVQIGIKECFALTEMIAENRSTTSGPDILETSGMIYINATANGKPLSIKKGKAFVIAFPKGKQNQDMDLFYDFAFNDSASTWVPDYLMDEAEASKAAQNGTAFIGEGDEIPIKYPFELTDDLYDYGFVVMGNSGTLYELPLAGQKRTIIDYINDPSTIADSVARKFVKNDWMLYWEFNIDAKGKITNLMLANDKDSKYNAYALKVVEDYLKKAPAFDLEKGNIEANQDAVYGLAIEGRRRLNQDRIKKRFRQQYSQYTDRAIQNMDGGTLNAYFFASTKMGWINCDRFWDIDKNAKTDFIVTAPSLKDAKVYLVFKDIKSIMVGTYQNGQVVFSNVPLGRPVKVIGISYAKGKPMLTVAETTINDNSFELPVFKEFSLDDLEIKLNN